MGGDVGEGFYGVGGDDEVGGGERRGGEGEWGEYVAVIFLLGCFGFLHALGTGGSLHSKVDICFTWNMKPCSLK